MANVFIEPTFALQSDWLTFLSRLWGITITVTDLADYEAYKLLSPTRTGRTDDEYRTARRQWDDSRAWVTRAQFYALMKWDAYKLGKVQPSVETYLSTRPSPNRTQAREAVSMQLTIKYAFQVLGMSGRGLTVANDLLPLVQGIVW